MEQLLPLGEVTLCVDSFGTPGDPLIVNIEGHGAQLISTPASYCARLAKAGTHVVRFDNRDVGRSTRMSKNYPLMDMVRDVHALINYFGSPAVVTGRSMGGAISQLLALHYPADVSGLGLFYTFSSPRPLGAPLPAPFSDEATYRAWYKPNLRAIAGSAYPWDEGELDALTRENWRRGVSWQGMERQRQAMAVQAPWAQDLSKIGVPTEIIHGTADVVVSPAEGKRLHHLIATANLQLVEGMGHGQPQALDDLFAQASLRLLR